MIPEVFLLAKSVIHFGPHRSRVLVKVLSNRSLSSFEWLASVHTTGRLPRPLDHIFDGSGTHSGTDSGTDYDADASGWLWG